MGGLLRCGERLRQGALRVRLAPGAAVRWWRGVRDVTTGASRRDHKRKPPLSAAWEDVERESIGLKAPPSSAAVIRDHTTIG